MWRLYLHFLNICQKCKLKYEICFFIFALYISAKRKKVEALTWNTFMTLYTILYKKISNNVKKIEYFSSTFKHLIFNDFIYLKKNIVPNQILANFVVLMNAVKQFSAYIHERTGLLKAFNIFFYLFGSRRYHK